MNKKDALEEADFKAQHEQTPGRKLTLQLPEVGVLTLEEVEIMMIKKAMEFHDNRISRAARSLGLTRSALYRRLEKYNMSYDETPD